MGTLCRIALFLMDNGDYQEGLRDDCVRTAARHSLPVRTFSADNDPSRQIAQVEACLGEPAETRPTVMLVHAVREVSLISTAHRATALGLGWIMLNRWSSVIEDLRGEYPGLPIFSVTPDQVEIGRIQGAQFLALLPRGGELVYIRGPLGTSSARQRFDGVEQVLAGSPIQLFSVNSDWTSGGGAAAMRSWMRLYEGRRLPPFVVGAQNDAMAMGALGAFEVERGRPEGPGQVSVFTGCDGSPRFGKRLVNERKLAATIVIPSTAGRAVSEVAAMLGGAPRAESTILLAPSSYPPTAELSHSGSADAARGASAFAKSEETRVRGVATLEHPGPRTIRPGPSSVLPEPKKAAEK
jgi:ABC-type sugar transport system substrate-binding protein